MDFIHEDEHEAGRNKEEQIAIVQSQRAFESNQEQ